MPTYRNDGENTLQVEKMSGERFQLIPGGQAESKYFIDNPDLFLISDEPVFNPSLKNEVITFGAAEEKTVNVEAGASEAMIWQVAGCNVEIFRQAVSNTPSWTVLRDGLDGTRITCDKTFNKLVLKSDGTGTCRVQQFQGELS